ncbi:MAG: TonB-dependent receptor [Pseudomonadota bacterium]
MEQVLPRAVGLAWRVGMACGALALAPHAWAQEAAAPMDRVEVTGSSIKRAHAETASPVQVIGADELLRSGKSSVAEFLQTLTADGAGALPTGFGNGFAAGSTAISLRGLGATSTLVLLNGRRMAPFARADDGQKSFTDLSTVPMHIVERIEILKDGASATYGADAIAGVVNIILRREFQGLTLKGDTGMSGYGDGQQQKLALTFGQGALDSDRYNVVVHAEYARSAALLNKDRAERAWIGHGDLRPYGYPIGTQFASGHIRGDNDATPSPTGSIRNPVDPFVYTSLPGCAALSRSSPQDPNGGCVFHQDQFRSLQPKIEAINLYTRGTRQLQADLQAYAELGYSKRDTSFTLTAPNITPTVAFPPNAGNPAGVINYGSDSGAIVLAAAHPQNPYGVPVRVRYAALDIGASTRQANNAFNRVVLGLKGAAMGWDYDAGFTHSASKLHLEYSNVLNMAVLRAALGDANSAYFPYYLGAEAGKNPAALYAAMVIRAGSDSTTELDIVDLKATRALWTLPGGDMGLAVGAEHRRQKLDNPSLSGTEDGSINWSYVSAKGDSKVAAVYGELLAPLSKAVELSGALRYDKYSHFSSTTPKLGAKWSPLASFALRATYTEGFRAPGPAESSTESLSTGISTVRDPVRCPNGTALPGATSTDCALLVAAVKVGNPDLAPEKSKGVNLGMVWSPSNATRVTLDAWRIKSGDEINPLPYNESAGLPSAVRSDNNLSVNGVPIPHSGSLLLTKVPYRNSSYTEVKGVDLDLRQRVRLGQYGQANFGLSWTHVASWVRAESESVVYQFAGTHGNCDVSNCAGTPKDKINLSASWDVGDWNVSGIVNYRSDLKNVLYEGDVCASQFANGADAPNGCSLASFTTVDLSARWNVSRQLQLFASINNVADKIAPLDPLTYGGESYNPMDASGAIGRYFRLGARYQF